MAKLMLADKVKVGDALAALTMARQMLLSVERWGEDDDVRLLQTKIDFCVETIENTLLFAEKLHFGMFHQPDAGQRKGERDERSSCQNIAMRSQPRKGGRQ